MNHVTDYFTGAFKKLFEKKAEKDLVLRIVQEISGVTLSKNEIIIKDGIIKIAVFGVKRSVLLSHRLRILDALRESGSTVRDLQ